MTVAPAQKFGRRLTVTVGGAILVDLDPRADQRVNLARNLHVDIKTTQHAKIEPMPTEVTIWGLSTAQQDTMDAAFELSRTVPWTAYIESQRTGGELPPKIQGAVIKCDAGYINDTGPIVNAMMLPPGPKHIEEGGGTRTVIKAQDFRLPWKNAFGDESLLPGVSLEDLQRTLAASSGFAAGEEADAAFQSRFDEFTRRNPVGLKGNFALTGDVKTVAKDLLDELGLEAFFVNGEYRYLRRDAITNSVAVVLTKTADALTDQRTGRGFRGPQVLFEHRLSVGRQVQYQFPDGRPVGQGIFRVDRVTHDLSSWQKPFWSRVTLRPANITEIDNLEGQ